jgi:uncharacterized membrane protein YuzA (DUF378 family)
VPLLTGLRRKPALLWWYVLVGFAIDLTISYYLKPNKLDRSWIANLYFLAEFIFLSFYVKNKIAGKHRQLFTGYVCLAALLFCVNTSQLPKVPNTSGAAVFHLAYLAYGIAGLYSLLQSQVVVRLDRSSFFWACVAFILYFSGNFLLFLFVQFYPEEKQAIRFLWPYIHCSLNIVYRTLLTLSLSKKHSS